ncbi:FMN-binding negative transcriptional regulator [Actinomadura latina]|uniref:FMN-binding negative transcriptional regulator n=2 Tax=Actinomadura latina TaxID=163603 RepID=A0A846Z5K4_9ACTN|nr:FMN-binding negative transcriptional regulator [Actinomadura latina]
MYRPRRTGDVIETVRRNPMALVAGNGARTPFATHAPVIIERLAADPGGADPLTGASLLGHMNRANPHWRALRDGGDVLAVFQGPHAYISPAAYEQRPAAPTWNFVTVHLRGRIEPLPPGEPTLGVVTSTVRELEKVAGTAWDMTDSLGYFRKILPGVGAFRVHVETVEAMFKLSQEHPAEVRRSIRDHLSAHGCGMGRELSEAMSAEELAADRRTG